MQLAQKNIAAREEQVIVGGSFEVCCASAPSPTPHPHLLFLSSFLHSFFFIGKRGKIQFLLAWKVGRVCIFGEAGMPDTGGSI